MFFRVLWWKLARQSRKDAVNPQIICPRIIGTFGSPKRLPDRPRYKNSFAIATIASVAPDPTTSG